MRILYCIDLLECKYVSVVNEFWIYEEDIEFRYAKLCFIDSCGTTYVSVNIDYNLAMSYLSDLVKDGYLNLEDTLFHKEDDD